MIDKLAAAAANSEDYNFDTDPYDEQPSLASRMRAQSREFEDVDLRRGNRDSPSHDRPGEASSSTAVPALPQKDEAISARERMRSRAGRMLSRTRSFVPTRKSRLGFIDDTAVADPDVVLMADVVLANRPPRSPPQTPTATNTEATSSAAASSSASSSLPSESRPVTNFLRIGRAEQPIRARPTGIGSQESSQERGGGSGSNSPLPPDAYARGTSRERGSREGSLDMPRSEPLPPSVLAQPSSLPAMPESPNNRAGASGSRISAAPVAALSSLERGATAAGSSLVQGLERGASAVGGAVAAAAGLMSTMTSTEESALRRRVEQLSAQLAATEAALRSAEEQSTHWQHCVHDLFNGLLLNPRMNARYELKISKLLEKALSKQEHIETVRYVKCSFPSVASDAPRLRLIQWSSLDSSEWEVRFAPCWKIELSLEGRSLMMPFKLLVRVGQIRMRGEMRVSFPPDLMHTLISFNTMPTFDMSIDSEVSLGSVPMPLQRGVSALLRYELRKWMQNKAVAPYAMKIKRSQPTDQPQQYGGSLDKGREASKAAQAAFGAAGSSGGSKASGSGDGGGGGGGGSQDEAAPSEESPPHHPETPAAPTGGVPGGGAGGGGGGGGTEETVRVRAASDEPQQRPAVSDEDLRRAILAALIKHDNPRVGVGRSRGGTWRRSTPTSGQSSGAKK